MRIQTGYFVNIWTSLLVVVVAFFISCISVNQKGVRAVDGSLFGSMASWQGITHWMWWGFICSQPFLILKRQLLNRYEVTKFSVLSFLISLSLIVWVAPNIWNYSDTVTLSERLKISLVSWLCFWLFL